MCRHELMRTLMLVSAFPLTLLATSCSTSAAGNPDKLAETRDRIIQNFKEESGQGFRRRSIPAKVREFGDLPRMERLDPERGKLSAKRYGLFTIFVYENRQARDSDMSGLGPPDAAGIYWYKDTPERRPAAGKSNWGAEKRYGENVLLTWWPSSGKRELTGQWSRLDALLKKSVG